MPDSNELIYIIRQVLGDETEEGFYLPVRYGDSIIKVPNYIFKDGKGLYPEIRISPFLSDEPATHSIRQRGYNLDRKISHYRALFQIDIYSDNLPQLNIITHALIRRINLFSELDNIYYGYDTAFKKKEGTNIYLNKEYNKKDYLIGGVSIGGFKFQRVDSLNKMNKYNTWYLSRNGLYINPDPILPFKRVRIQSIINGMLLPNGDSIKKRGIGNLKISNKRLTSDLEDNKSERMTFDLLIFYQKTQGRNPGPILEKFNISDKNG